MPSAEQRISLAKWLFFPSRSDFSPPSEHEIAIFRLMACDYSSYDAAFSKRVQREMMTSDDRSKSKADLLEELRSLRVRVGETECCKDARFRKIFEYSNDGIFLVDPMADEILDVNEKACSMLGYAREELLAAPMSKVHPNEMDRMRKFAESVFESGKGWTDQFTCTTKSGRGLSAEISASIIDLAGRKCMVAMVRDISARARLEREKELLLDEIKTELGFGSIIGRSSAIKNILEQVKLVAPTEAGVLISGESGTGKELVARAIHEQSGRSGKAMVRVNCASIPAELFESEFFGHIKGSFTGALRDRRGRFDLADGGTLLLDEVGEIPLELQGKLLRVLQEGLYERVGESHARRADVRILAATNRNLLAASKEGRFRQDLYYRLSVFPIEIPPLREHPEDIAPLAEHFVRQACERLKVPHLDLPDDQLRVLETYSWPGNVRELQNVIERAVILGRESGLHFDLGGSSGISSAPAPSAAPKQILTDGLSLADVKRFEKEIIIRALDRSGWKISGKDGAAAHLGLRPTTLTSRLKKLGLKRPVR
jgi:PAS domain S-box-containing protein